MMNKFIKAIITTALCVTALAAMGCGGAKSPEKQLDTSKPIKIGVTPGPHAEIMENVKKMAEKQGLKIELMEFSDYVTPNTALAQGELWGNCFQHKPFLDATLKKEPKFDLVSAFPTALFPIGIYSNKLKPGDKIPDGATIAIPNDPSNGSRSILLLANAGLIKVKDIKNIDTSLHDITENPHNYKIIELEAAAIPRSLDDVTCAAINTNYALSAHLNPAKDALLRETADSFYVNIFAVRKETLKDPRLEQLRKIYQSKENAQFILNHFPGSVSIGWKE
ncbi:D-methionine-binding lipoprotein MetQ [bioreactor metagenome]|jgi:ABC-type metal ion transport system, periplasmic component/surface antigen|uniref:D-methionine-binding lipoprotein MetQ n=1 Tax=bioreactor metagenome TaxID=1076179 RepID=A0A644UHB7_9ZZZZ|nr:MetQ/NlpA family ABC transporter substrate-binding protein [Acidaminococcaceae bacterium]